MILAYVIVGLVTMQRLGEIAYAERNARALLQRGAKEVGRGHFPLLVLLHAAWLVAIAVTLPRHLVIHWVFLTLFAMLQIARLWVIVSLKGFWTTRIITLPGEPLVRHGPYRYLRHPNYAIVVGEIALLPLAFGQTRIALIFSILNLGLLAWRIRQEDAALAARREGTPAVMRVP